MTPTTAVVIFLYVYTCADKVTAIVWNRTCGIDLSNSSKVYPGDAEVEDYPWIGILYYPGGNSRLTTAVVLITKQMVLASAMEIDRLPKRNFRARTAVVLGSKCGENEIPIRDYTYHPEFYKGTINTLALVQLETDHVTQELRPICAPFVRFENPDFFAMTISKNCYSPKLTIYQMQHVNTDQCMDFYRRSRLDHSSIWPSHVACARSVSGGKCLWRSGSILAIRQDSRWSLLGFSIYGPGCGAPSRFIDFGKYYKWVQKSVATVGQPSVTRLDTNIVVLRRSLSNMQRFGPCDPEETKLQLYTDKVQILQPGGLIATNYNVSIYETVEYSCIIFKARGLDKQDFDDLKMHNMDKAEGGKILRQKPMIRVKRWCSTPTRTCYGFQMLEIQFFVEIISHGSVELEVYAYGKNVEVIDAEDALAIALATERYPRLPKYDEIIKDILKRKETKEFIWFFIDDVASAFGMTKNQFKGELKE